MINYSRITIVLLGFIIIFSSCAEKQSTKFSKNPISEEWYADPEGAIFGNKFWIFPTYSAKFDKQVFFDAFSSEDLINWTKHEHVLDTCIVKWAKRALWAPAIIENNGKYFLFFGANDIQNPDGPYWSKERANETGGIGVAVADKPEGPYVDYLGKPLINGFHHGAQPIDQFVFKDKDGQHYIIYGGWGHCNIAKINDDFKNFTPFDDGETFKEITPKGYVEGPFMFIRKGKYYFMWSEGGWGDSSYKVAYSIADNPLGPFKRLATILQSDSTIATGAGHHSVMNIPNTDDWYIVYHRRPIPNKDRDHRVTCIDRMYFNEDGTIKPVKMTFKGVAERKLD